MGKLGFLARYGKEKNKNQNNKMSKEKFLVTIYQETYTTFEVEANDKEEAENLAVEGEGEVDDVVVKNSEVITAERKI